MFMGTAVKRATKTKLRVSARDRFDRGNLQLHATSGTKRARSGRVAIPSRFTQATGGPGVYERRCDCAPWSTHRRASSTGMAHAMRFTNAMVAVASRSGCSTSCNPEQGYRNASASMRTQSGSRGRYRPSYLGETSVRQSGLHAVRSKEPIRS